MSLCSILTVPEYKITIPSTGEVMSFRPFLVKEEKLLLIAQQGKDPIEIITAIKKIIKACIPELGPFDLDLYPAFDIEYLFLKIRAKSINNIIKLSYRDNEDDKVYDFEVNLDDIEVLKNPNHTNKIKVSDTVSIIMKYPSLSLTDDLKVSKSEIDLFLAIVRNCIDKIYDNDILFDPKKYSKEELDEFINSLPVDTFNQIQDFFETSPKIYHELLYTNSKGNERKIKLQTLTDFFYLA